MTVIGAPAVKSAYLSLSAIGDGESTPILFGSNPMGDALLSTGVMTFAGASAMVPVLPVRISGFDVRETLRRLDADPRPPSPERGVTGANRVGEALGRLTMRWLVAPDGFEATASMRPPNTELDTARSQRFVMHDGVLRFQDRTQSGARFFGAGRTYPVNADGVVRLLFAGVAVVVEGLGSLKCLRGSLSVIGEISGRSVASVIVTGRFDGDGPFETVERLGPMIERAPGCPGAAVLTLTGESGRRGAMGHVEERIHAARMDNDLSNAMQPRCTFRTGEMIGRATGPLRFDPSDRRCAVRLVDAWREMTFTDAAGQPVAAVVADSLEGTAFPDQQAGEGVSRVIAYGALSGGTGSLANVGGVMTMDTAVSADGTASSIYTIWLADERGRFRAARAAQPVAAVGGVSVAEREERLVEASAASMLPSDLEIVAHADRTLAEGDEIVEWFRDRSRSADYRERFEVVREYESDDESFGFFDVATIGGEQLPVMGIVQEMFYDRLKLGSAEPIREQLAEFVLRYLLRVSHVGEPEQAPPRHAGQPSALERAMSWLPIDGRRPPGSGYEQLYYKSAETGRIGKFGKDERAAIVDMRELGRTYDWVLLKGDTLSFDFPFVPFGAEVPRQVPAKQATYLVTGPAFIVNRRDPQAGVLSEYGFGYAFLPYSPDGSGLLAYGPGRFRAAVQSVTFTLTADGQIRARTAFVVTRPERIAAMNVDPIRWSVQLADLVTFRMASRFMSPVLAVADRLPLHASDFDPVAAYIWMANTMTGGMAENYLGISKAALERRMLFHHLRSHQEMLHRSLRLWRMVPDWTAHEKLPEFCRRGMGC